MGCCQCLRDPKPTLSLPSQKHKENKQPKEKRRASAQVPEANQSVAPGQRRISAPSRKKLQLSLPRDTDEAVSSPDRPSLSPRTCRELSPASVRKSKLPRTFTTGSWRGSRRSSNSENLIVRLRSLRMVPEGLETCYRLKKQSLGSLIRAEHRDTKKKCWIQAYNCEQEKNCSKLKQRLVIAKSLDHPNVLRMLDLAQDKGRVYAVYEATEGGTVKDFSEQTRGIDEQRAGVIMRQVFSALRHCHSKGLSLKSLTLQNLLFQEPPTEDRLQVKLLVYLNEKTSPVATTKFGKQTCVDQATDLWRCGVILGELLTGESVLLKRQPGEVTEDYKSAYKTWQGMSAQVKSLTRALINKDVSKRPTLKECLQHPWLSVLPRTPTLSPCLRMALRNMAKVRPSTSLKKSLLELIFNLVLPYEDLKAAQQAFKELDTSLDGTVSEQQLRVQIYRLFPEEQAQAVLTAITSTAVFTGGKLAYSEFLLLAGDRQELTSLAHLTTTFQLLDRGHDGL